MAAMRPKTRLAWIAVLILGSVVYAFLVAADPELARTVGVGYIAVVLSIFVANELWRSP